MTRVLIDNCVPRTIKPYISHLEVTHVSEIGWEALEDPDLLDAAEEVYDVLLSGDKNLPQQNRLSDYKIGIIIMRAASNTLNDFLPLIDEINKLIPKIKPRQTEIRFAPGYRPRK